VVPDIICLSKGITGGALPLAVTVASPPIFEAHLSDDRSKMFFHSSSYTANPMACAAAVANLEIWQDEPVLDRVAALGAMQAEMLDDLATLAGVFNPRRLGTITAFELGSSASDYLATSAPQLGAFFRDRGVLLRPLGNTLYVMPPYCIGRQQLAQVYGAIGEAVKPS
jgi:adenosylmethionine---8-amino-7-oxononanoate aminotransferase